MSTSLLVSKMQEAADERGIDAKIAAYPIGEVKQRGADADCILIGPQVRYAMPQVTSAFPDKPVAAIEMVDYGMVDGQKVLDLALSIIEK